MRAHGLSYAGARGASQIPAVVCGQEMVLTAVGLVGPAHNAAGGAFDLHQSARLEARGAERRQIAKPEAGRLARVIAVLVRLDDLGGGHDAGPDQADRILKAEARYEASESHQVPHELKRLFRALMAPPAIVPMVAAAAQASAWRMNYEEVPFVSGLEQVEDVALIVATGRLAWQ